MFRYPDSPSVQMGRAALDKMPRDYFAQLKMDGWRCVVERSHDGLKFTSRHNKPIPISSTLREHVQFLMLKHGIPVGTVFDCEWLARRPAARDEALWFFDVMQIGDQPLWSQPTRERFSALQSLMPAEWIVPCVRAGYEPFFDSIMDRGDAEGIVLKHKDAKYIGSVRQCALNPGWMKCKHRGGESGETILEAATVQR